MRALRPLQYYQARAAGEMFDVKNAAWAEFYVSRGLAEEVCALAPTKTATTGKKSKDGTRPAVDTDRGVPVTRADMAAPLVG